LTPGLGTNPVYAYLADFVKAIVRERTDPDTLPGLAAMMPESPLVKILNHPELKVGSPLHIITGDAKSCKLWPAVMSFAGNLFFAEDHDLVVPASSMRMGTPRQDKTWEHFSAEKNVDHFKYFMNEGSRNAVLNALDPGAITSVNFKPIEQIAWQTRKVGTTQVFNPDRPTVFLLPGIMGSHLKAEEGSRLWVNYTRIVKGGLSQLQIDAQDIVTDGIHDPSYADLVDYLRMKDYNVIPFAYDWRKDLTETADLLAAEVKEIMGKTKETISFVAHSMGGVLLRTMIGKHGDLYNALKSKDKFRVLLLGVPLEGSYSIPRLLMGRDKILHILALMDIVNRRDTLLTYFAQYPGLMQLLPRKDHRMKDISFWNDLKEQKFIVPNITEKELKYLEAIDKYFQESLWDPAIFKYIAGKDDRTPNGINREKSKLEIGATPHGDGRVTWDSIPTELRNATFYVDAVHGDIPDHRKSFEGYVQLLQSGDTGLLSRTKPATRQLYAGEVMPDTDYAEYPTANGIDDAIGGKRSIAPKTQADTEVKVTLTHGDLAQAMYPVVVGHFKGDAILYAEAALDKHLGRKLSMRHEIGQYAEEIGENVIVLLPGSRALKGGIAIGLGNFGELTEGNLTKSIRFALTNYLIKKGEDMQEFGEDQAVGVSMLLIGSGFGSLFIINTIKSIFNAITEVNKRVANQSVSRLPQISHVEIIEMYRFKIVQCYRLISALTKDRKYSAFQLDENIKKVSGRKDGIPDEINSDWWHRIKISLAVNEDQSTEKLRTRPIVFTSITDRSRAEEKTLDTNRVVVDALIKQAARISRFDPKLSKALFELLVPNEFKSYTSGLKHMVLIVDKETARYPWELMSSSEKGETLPIAVKAGMLRQLSTAAFRLQVENVSQNTALVVGDPRLHGKYNQLPGAKAEAENVARLLNDNGFEVTAQIQTESTDIIVDLLSQQYKIFHFAAHGISNDPETGETGVVIGPDMILTPSIFKQIRMTPELVFVNCCSLGEINKDEEAYLQAKYEVAASVGCQLIEMGVKAVVLAGWEVEDQAAKRFSEVVYESLLSGEDFGTAVLKARGVTYEFKGSNTWGAYQCYGDPFYKLNQRQRSTPSSPEIIADAEEAITYLDNFNYGLDTSYKRASDQEARIESVIKMERKIPARFTRDARVLERIAEAYSKAGDLKTAIDRYQRLYGIDDANFTVRAVEQLQNLRIRHLQECYESEPTEIESVKEICDDCIKELNALNTRQKTAERLNLIGSTYKRVFMMLRDPEYLQHTERAYFEANQFYLDKNQGKIHYYPFYNWATAYALAKIGADLSEQDPPEQEKILEAEAHIADLSRSKPDFWNKTAPSMKYLYQLIVSEKPTEIADLSKQLIENFKDAWAIEGNENNRRSHLDQFRFVLAALKMAKTQTSTKGKVKALEAAFNAIERME
jgi:CHAT domain-containing protein